MPFRPLLAILIPLLCLSCRQPEPGAKTLTVAAAANLTGAMDEVVAAFKERSGLEVNLSYGSTAQLAQQVRNGAPFDVFAAADTEHVDSLAAEGKLDKATRTVYARGQLALWAPASGAAVNSLGDLTKPQIKFIAVAQPTLAPYGRAAVEALKAAGIWEKTQAKLVYANNVNMARQYAASGNANAALTAYSLVMKDTGAVLKIDPQLYQSIEQAVAVTTATQKPKEAQRFLRFLLEATGRQILANRGYLAP
jgi:molybdate transport system substrate-binding protein